jgi:hypothetical protein
MDAAMAGLFNRCAREELEEALDDDDLEHCQKFEPFFTRIFASEEDESGRFNFRGLMTDAEIRDAAHDWAARLKDVNSKIRSYYMDAWRDHLCFVCRECEDSRDFRFDSFRSADAAVTVAHIMEEHPPPPLVKSAKKC